MNETALRFGPDARLAGIVTAPASGRVNRGFILVSAGLMPKSGPHRLYVELARRLADEGIATLRFDLGGIGDSVADASGLSLGERTGVEVRAAIEHLASRFALDGVTLAGLCSGAEDSLRSAALDPRVSAVVMIDPFAYRAPGWFWRHALHRLGRRALRALGLHVPLAARAAERPRVVRYRYMERTEASALLARLIGRGTRVHFLYTAGVREWFNHPSELAAAFPELDFGDRVTVDFFAELDHTQLLAADRRTLVEAIARRVREPAFAD
ncbi:MAG TPA: hypothetical protein VMI54_02045 [Polyangiaceae bacterium]|nr:hypothetical protein [Polyangiaceae bacterium]